MAKQSTRKKGSPGKTTAKSKTVKKTALADRALSHGKRICWLFVECIALGIIALVAVITTLGRATERFAGVDLWGSLVPFAGAVLVLTVVIYLALRLWIRMRNCAIIQSTRLPLPALMATVLALYVSWLASGEGFRDNLEQMRSLVGGRRQAETSTLSHQVYAAYRRSDLTQMQVLLERAKPYEAIIQEAADIYHVDAEILLGLGATESSFMPRDSKDGGRGLFQITSPPKAALQDVGKHLEGQKLDWRNPRHNALIAAATWHYYLEEMQGDLFLALLAYNIGPKNGGLLSIMRQYGAKDFVTIQPYLQNLPRDYPIRVLTAALAFRLYKAEEQLPRYEETGNARRIQAVGIPGLDAG
ncbi:MAG: transglycosylase SLT domain-containing protein [Desulfobulbaceae bacterium]|nr:transglycosylase SLT domain-containing protein [Desulfobulbaceae bacterium]